jgi:hypothetical protein
MTARLKGRSRYQSVRIINSGKTAALISKDQMRTNRRTPGRHAVSPAGRDARDRSGTPRGTARNYSRLLLTEIGVTAATLAGCTANSRRGDQRRDGMRRQFAHDAEDQQHARKVKRQVRGVIHDGIQSANRVINRERQVHHAGCTCRAAAP